MIQISGLQKRYGTQTLFENATLVLGRRERVGLIGRNGSGKSTLFKMLLDEEHPDDGTILMPKGYRIGHLSRHLKFTKANILEEVCVGLPEDEKDETYRGEIILSGLGFTEEDYTRPASDFSGGYQIRLNLGRLLLSSPDLLLLDEPTNYLDIVSSRWLAETLRAWKGELIIITHDRSFMDSVTTHTALIYRSNFKKVEGNSEKLLEAVRVEEEVYEKTRANNQKKRDDMMDFISRFRAQASKANLVQSRVKALERMETMEELRDEATLDFNFSTTPFHGRAVLSIDDLQFAYPNSPTLVSGLSFQVGKNDRIGIIGKNGRGKSTLLKLIAGELKPTEGEIIMSPSAVLGYFGQTNVERLTPRLSVEEEVASAHPNLSRTRVRNICGTMMFDGDKALKKVSVLSGGEKSRVLLGKIIATPTNLLMLDEPTNHLDLESVESLREALGEYAGAVIVVTHNEGMLRALCTRLIVFQGDVPFVFEGGYDYFLDKIGWEEEEALKPTKRKAVKEEPAPKKEQKTDPKVTQKKIEKIEKEIELLESQDKELDRLIDEFTENGEFTMIDPKIKEKEVISKKIHALFAELEKL